MIFGGSFGVFGIFFNPCRYFVPVSLIDISYPMSHLPPLPPSFFRCEGVTISISIGRGSAWGLCLMYLLIGNEN